MGYQPEIERFLENTNPDYVNLCLDTGHVAYYGGDCVELITKYPERIGYVHLKQVNPKVVEHVLDHDLSFPEAVRMGAMIEPPFGLPEMPPVLAALDGLGREIKGIIEHDLYPCPPETPAADREADQGVPVELQRRRDRHGPGRLIHPGRTTRTSSPHVNTVRKSTWQRRSTTGRTAPPSKAPAVGSPM